LTSPPDRRRAATTVLAGQYQEAAKENLALAKEHHELAEVAPK